MASASMATSGLRYTNELPPLDRCVEAEIAAVVNLTLPQDDKLPINGSYLQEILNNALGWADSKNMPNADSKFLFLSGIATIIACGMLRTRNGIPDGDWYETSNTYELTEATWRMLQERLNRDALTTANTIICATKVNFWHMNHHVGQTTEPNTAQGYLQKALLNKFGANFPPGLVHVCHMLGHYASTRFILQQANIPNILPTEVRAGLGTNKILFTDDIKLEFRAPPAGTSRMAVCYRAANILARSSYARFCPNIEDFTILPRWQSTVMADPAKYHVEALYLCGSKDASYDDNQFERFIGRLGVCILELAPKSIFAKSPHFTESKIESASDFDPTWRQTLQHMQRNIDLIASRQLMVEEVPDEAAAAAKELRRAFLSQRIQVPGPGKVMDATN
jgi:hypothetical protein